MTSASDVSAHRTSSSSEWLHTHLDKPIVRTVLQRAAELLQIPGVIPSDFELQLVHYAPCAPSVVFFGQVYVFRLTLERVRR